MNCKCFDSEGKETFSGELTEKTDIPPHGSISIRIGMSNWISLLTSERMIVKHRSEPFNWRGYQNEILSRH